MRRNPFPSTERKASSTNKALREHLPMAKLKLEEQRLFSSRPIPESLLFPPLMASLSHWDEDKQRKSALRAKNFFESVGFALTGIRYLLKEERNFRLHVLLAGFAFSLGLLFQIATWEWIVLLIGTALMLSVEAINTAVECAVDLVVGEQWVSLAGKIKDITAAACLMMALCLGTVGILLFWPHLAALIINSN
jgi:undecaprenol kinase